MKREIETSNKASIVVHIFLKSIFLKVYFTDAISFWGRNYCVDAYCDVDTS